MKKHLLVIVFLLVYLIITCYKLISNPTPFYDWDESIYAQVGREMTDRKSIVPLWQGQFWLDKPPLTPLAYGIVEKILPFSPEITTRIFTLALSVSLLMLIYIFYYRVSKNQTVAFLTVVVTTFTPIFLQRSQVLNVDVFLLLGWYGYLVFYENFSISLMFLIFGVLSKSMLGFYPLIGMLAIETALFSLKKIKWETYWQNQRKKIIQCLIVSLWFIGMLLVFKFAFIKNQFLEAMLKRITASIESHFGKRTFYLDTLIEQLKYLTYFSILSLTLFFKDFMKYKDIKKIAYLLFFVPWFAFLNLTKTKIAWYLYPVIPQFAFLGVYGLILIRSKRIQLFTSIIVVLLIFYQSIFNNHFLSTFYSSYDEYYYLANYAKDNCSRIEILIDPDTRKTNQVLNSMGLTISTTRWWGNHPAIVYYSGKKVDFIYETPVFIEKFAKAQPKQCFVITPIDLQQTKISQYTIEKKFKDIYLITKP